MRPNRGAFFISDVEFLRSEFAGSFHQTAEALEVANRCISLCILNQNIARLTVMLLLAWDIVAPYEEVLPASLSSKESCLK